MSAPADLAALKKAAYATTRRALASGLLTRAKFCAHCGSKGPIVGHHRDYTQPLMVVWVCSKCHQWEHEAHADWGGVCSGGLESCILFAQRTGRTGVRQISRAVFGDGFGKREVAAVRAALKRMRREGWLQEAAE